MDSLTASGSVRTRQVAEKISEMSSKAYYSEPYDSSFDQP